MSQMFLRLQSAFSGNAAKVASTSSSARTVAKDRLSVILASQRGSELFDSVCMETLQKDVLKVVERHINVAKNRPVNFSVNTEGNVRLFEMSMELQGRRLRPETTKTSPQRLEG